MTEEKTTKERFDRLLDAMAHGKRPSGKRKAKAQTSHKDASGGYAETQPPKGTSGDASLKPKRGSG